MVEGVTAGTAGSATPSGEPRSTPAPLHAVVEAAARFLGLLPALVAALLWLRAAEFAAGWPAGTPAADAAWGVARALADDALALLRYLVPLYVLCLPLLLPHSPRARFWGIGLAWSAVVLVQACLVEYFLIAGVPLGADLYTYSLHDVGETTSAGIQLHALVVAGTLLALASLWLGLGRRMRGEESTLATRGTVVAFALALAVLLFGPAELPPARAESEYARSLRLSKVASFIDSSVAYFAGPAPAGAHGSAGVGGAPGALYGRLDPAHPFLHPEQTPDALGEHFATGARTPPNLVFLIVEGLGRSFSGPGAELGSFTPFLDELAAKSLYWDNFLAVQGRTFGLLPSVFGSLPFGERGFAALDARMPEHATLLSVLKSQGYRLRFYTGTDAKFDNERMFLERQGVDAIFDRRDFGPGYPRTSEWGYDDDELVSFALAEEARDPRQPFVDVIQTITMHDPYRFRGQERYQRPFEERLARLGIAEGQKAGYRAYRNIYTSVMYTDAALRRYFAEASKRPGYANTIFIVTGDHRLPEIPLSEWIDRYHVPLLVYSPLLKAPLRVKSVSSDFDIAPSLLAFLAHRYGIRTPPAVTWVGTGLDLEPAFRNVHDIPLKQTKANLVDFASGGWFVSRDALYLLRDGMHTQPVDDAAALAGAGARFAAFRDANAQFARTLALMPRGAASKSAAYVEQQRTPLPAATTATAGAALAVRNVRSPEHARAAELAIDVEFGNAAAEPSELFVPLVVLVTLDGHELSETYGGAQVLPPRQSVTVHLPLKAAGVPPGRYFLSVYPSDPATGKRSGDGRFRIPVVIDG
jgi:phosphoglycerol transferase MdoB-like AlkP superfamily enzyme